MLIHYVTKITAILALLMSVSVASAQQERKLSWSDIESAIERHPALKLIEGETAAAEAEIGISRQYPNPELGASIGQGRSLDGSETALIWGIELEIPIDAPGAYLNETEAAQAGYQAAKYDASARRLEILRQLKGLFFRIVIGQELLRVQNESLDQVDRLVQVARLRVDQGEARPMEVARLEIEQEKLQADAFAAGKQLAAFRANLNLWLGGKLPDDFEVESDWRTLPDIPDLSVVVENARKRHPSLLAAARRIVASEAQTRAERHRLFPEIKLGGFYDRELDAHNYGGMLTIELPLWNWNRGGIAKARADESATRHRRELAEHELISAIQQAQAAASQAIERARRYAESILPKARHTGEALDAMYRVGETNIIDVLDTRRNLIETETDMLAAFNEGWLAYLDLITLMGGDHE